MPDAEGRTPSRSTTREVGKMRSRLAWQKYLVYRWWHDKLPLWVAYRLPRRVAMWAAVRVGAHATTGAYGDQIVPELAFMDALQRWDATP